MSAFWRAGAARSVAGLREGGALGTALGFYLLVVDAAAAGARARPQSAVAHRARASCGSRCCWRRCSRSAASSRPTGGRLAGGPGDRAAAARARVTRPRRWRTGSRPASRSPCWRRCWACCSTSRRGLPAARRDHARRHAGDQLPWLHWRCPDPARAPRRAAAGAAGAAALRADADLRHRDGAVGAARRWRLPARHS